MTDKEQQERMFNKIRGLLRKAEGTDNEHEAATFYNHAQKLIMRYAIDEQALWADDPSKRSKIETLHITIPDRSAGSQEKRQILNAVAKANRCEMWYSPGMDRSTIAGYSSDTLFVEMLFSSIQTQMNFAMAVGQVMNPTVHHKTFKTSFMVGFAHRISDRFREMARANMEEVKNENPGMEIALLDRAAEVRNWVDENMNLTRGSRKQRDNINHAAYGSGRSAANQTDLSGGRGTMTRQKEIGK